MIRKERGHGFDLHRCPGLRFFDCRPIQMSWFKVLRLSTYILTAPVMPISSNRSARPQCPMRPSQSRTCADRQTSISDGWAESHIPQARATLHYIAEMAAISRPQILGVARLHPPHSDLHTSLHMTQDPCYPLLRRIARILTFAFISKFH